MSKSHHQNFTGEVTVGSLESGRFMGSWSQIAWQAKSLIAEPRAKCIPTHLVIFQCGQGKCPGQNSVSYNYISAPEPYGAGEPEEFCFPKFTGFSDHDFNGKVFLVLLAP